MGQASRKAGADEMRSAPDTGGLRPGRAGSVGLSHEGSAHAAPPRPIGPPARTTAPSLLPRAGASFGADHAATLTHTLTRPRPLSRHVFAREGLSGPRVRPSTTDR